MAHVGDHAVQIHDSHIHDVVAAFHRDRPYPARVGGVCAVMDADLATESLAGRRIVVYTLALPDDDDRLDAVWRLGGSVSTLRAHNRTVPVVVFVFGEIPG